jgi:hypothetical protein
MTLASMESDPATAEEVRHRRHGLAPAASTAADGENQVSQGEGFAGLFHNRSEWRFAEKLKKLSNPGADDPAVVGQADFAAFDQVGHGGSGFIGVAADAAHGEDEVTQGEAGADGGFVEFFHGLVGLRFLVGELIKSSLAEAVPRTVGFLCSVGQTSEVVILFNMFDNYFYHRSVRETREAIPFLEQRKIA